ncbi:hypothetical protein ACIHCX_31185 [Streptomyces sp. NPDC052043]|uniref:hypothetical protein n=1 Tax=Streptomyces sp. NPDC052043 TaxID=3365684 RepID=UPI0037D1B0E8
MRKAHRLAVVMLAAAGMIGASASMAAADGSAVTSSNFKFAPSGVTALDQCDDDDDDDEDEGSSAASAAASAAASSSDGSSAAAAAAAASAASGS